MPADWLTRYADPEPTTPAAGGWLSSYGEPPAEEPGAFSKFYSWATKGLATPAALRAGESITAPTLDRGMGEAQLRGFLAGALEGASNTFTSPLGIVSTVLGGLPGASLIKSLPASVRAVGGGLAGVAEALQLPGLARGVAIGNAAMGIPALAHGSGEVLEGVKAGDLHQIGQGAIETGMGALGTVAPFLHPGAARPAAAPGLKPSGTPPPVKLGLPEPVGSRPPVTPSNDLARKADYFAKTGRTVPARGSMAPPTSRINVPLREGNPAALEAFLAGPEPLDVFSVPPSVPLQEWTPPAPVEPSVPRVAAGEHLQEWNPTPGTAEYNPNRLNAPLRESNLAALEAFLRGPEPIDPSSVSPSVPLQDWTPSGADVGANPNRLNEPPPQRSAAQLLEDHFFPNGRRTVPEQNILPAAPWLDDVAAPPPANPRGGPPPPPPGAAGVPVMTGLDDDLEALAALDRRSNLEFLERILAPFRRGLSQESAAFQPPASRAPVAGNVTAAARMPQSPRPVPGQGQLFDRWAEPSLLSEPEPQSNALADLLQPASPLPAPSQDFSDPDVISRLFAYGPSRTLESLTTSGMEPFISPDIAEVLAAQPGGMGRPQSELLEAAREEAQRWVAPNERDLPWRERLAMRSNEERYQHAINEPDRPASLSALERVSQPESLADRLERELRERTRPWEDFTSEEKAAVYEGRTQRHMREVEEARAQEAAAQAALEASLPKRFADATPEEQRELRRMLEELRSFPFVKRSFNFDIPGQGGSADVVAGAGGAPIFHDIMGGRSGSRNAAIRALEAYVEGGKPATAISRRAAHVARRAAEGDPTLRRRMLPPDAGDVPPPPDPAVDFPFGANDPTGESGFVSTDPEQWKQVADQTGKSLEALRFFSMLSGPLTHAKNIAGNLGAVTMEAARRGIRGDLRGAGSILKETFSPEWVRDLRAGFNHPESGAWTPETADRPRTGILSWPSRAAEAPDYATRQALRRAGLTDQEARHVTFTGDPRSQSGKAFVEGVRRAGALGRLVSPFPRIATNLMEVGLEHTPIAGSVAQLISNGRLQSGWDKQALGALAMLAGATFEGFEDPRAQAVFQAALGPVNLPYTIGSAVAKGMENDDSLGDVGKAVWNRFSDSSPLPQYLSGPNDWLAQHVPTAFQQLGLTDPQAVRDEANAWWPVGKAVSKLPFGDRLLSGPAPSTPTPQSSWLDRYADR